MVRPNNERRQAMWRRVLPLVALACLVPLEALASEGHGFVLKEHGYYILDFLLLLIVLILVLRGPLKNFFQKRRNQLEEEIDEARRLQAEALEKLEEYQKRLAGVEEEVARIADQAKRDAEALKARLIAEGKAQAEKLAADAEARIKQERQALRHKLEQQLVEAALATAAEKIRGSLDEGQQREFLRRYVDEMDRLGN